MRRFALLVGLLACWPDAGFASDPSIASATTAKPNLNTHPVHLWHAINYQMSPVQVMGFRDRERMELSYSKDGGLLISFPDSSVLVVFRSRSLTAKSMTSIGMVPKRPPSHAAPAK
jgi:hypothetical protein